MKKHTRSPRTLRLNKDKARAISPGDLVQVQGGDTVQVYPSHEYVIRAPDSD